MTTSTAFIIAEDAENNLSIEWSIPDFFSLESIYYKKSVSSPDFKYLNLNWKIVLNRRDEYWNIELWRISLAFPHTCVYYNIGIKKIDGTVYKSKSAETTITSGFYLILQNYLKTERFLLPSDLQRDKAEISPGNALVIFCNLSLKEYPTDKKYFLIHKEIEKSKFKNVCAQTENAERKFVSMMNKGRSDLHPDVSESLDMKNKQKKVTNVANDRRRCAYCYATRVAFPDRRFFRFPKDEDLCKKWVFLCQRPYLKNKTAKQLNASFRLCSEHFIASDFSTSKQLKLKTTAYPKFLSEQSSTSSSNDISLVNLKEMLSAKLATQENASKDLTIGTPPNKKRKFDDGTDACKETFEEDFQETKEGVHCESKVTLLNSSGTYELVKNLRDLFMSGEDSDAVMMVGDKEFRVHKAILRSRSTVFSAMFRHDMKEPRSGIVDITDCDPQVFEQFLLYVYTGKVDCLSPANVCHLYQTADKFDIQDLKMECLEYMQKNLSVESFCDVTSLALLHNETGLLENATQFFMKNAPKIVVTVKWISFMKEKPIEANELIIKGFKYLVPPTDLLS